MEMTKKINERIRYDRESLAQRCRILAERLITITNRLESDKPHRELCINNLGEIQAEGTQIDASCGKLMGEIEALSW